MERTSRWWLLDMVNFIADNIAFVSHAQELINANSSTQDNLESNADLITIRDEATEMRRFAMQYIQKELDCDKHYWCLVKHAIWSYQYATECLYANINDPLLVLLQQKAYENMVATVSKRVKSEMVTCSRCLEDNIFWNES